jgi:putative membrane protein
MLNLLSKSITLGLIVDMEKVLPVLATTLIFVFIGLIVFGIAYWIVVKLAPFSVHKEIEEDQNVALGIIIGAIIIGIAMIISSAIQGN